MVMVGVVQLKNQPIFYLVGSVTILGLASDIQKRSQTRTPESMLRQLQHLEYDPDVCPEWSGTESGGVEAHVTGNPDKTAVLIDPSGEIKRQLLDSMFRGQKRIIAPKMETLKLSKDVSMELGLKDADSLGLGELGRLMNKVTKPPRFRLVRFFRRSKTGPFICIIDIPKDATENDVVVLLRSAARLKEAAGKSVVTIACLEAPYDITKLPLRIQQFDVLS